MEFVGETKQQEEERFRRLKERYEAVGQGHIFDLVPNIAVGSKLFQQLENLDIETSLSHFRNAQLAAAEASSDNSLQPIKDIFRLHSCVEQEVVKQFENVGLEAIGNGKVAAVIMSGGQGTRLGYHGPKGMYSIGLLSGKTIFQLHIERLQKVRLLASFSASSSDNSSSTSSPTVDVSLPIFIMTSDVNDDIIKNYFKENNYFGYPSNQIFFFEQGLEPCFTPDGKIILESPDLLSLAPDGNGGIYHALRKSGSIDRMTSLGVEHLHVYGIDNILTRSADPIFLGYCISNSLELGNKVVSRFNAAEKVGVTALHTFRHPITGVVNSNRLCIVEYSELPLECTGEDETGQLIYSAANICNHYFSLSFLLNSVFPSLYSSYHIAQKKIPYYDPETQTTVTPQQNNGIKLEMFIFDIFSLAERYGVMEVRREDEFAPVKNAPGSGLDSPETARELLSNQCIRWLSNAGVTFVTNEKNGDEDDEDDIDDHCTRDMKKECEISPLLSYAGEGLDHLRGANISLPCYLRDFQITEDLQF